MILFLLKFLLHERSQWEVFKQETVISVQDNRICLLVSLLIVNGQELLDLGDFDLSGDNMLESEYRARTEHRKNQVLHPALVHHSDLQHTLALAESELE
jgi:hypothetical protein